MVKHTYIINKGLLNQIKHKIKILNQNNLLYAFNVFQDTNIMDMSHLSVNECKKWLTEKNKCHYMIIQIKFTNRGTTLIYEWVYQPLTISDQ